MRHRYTQAEKILQFPFMHEQSPNEDDEDDVGTDVEYSTLDVRPSSSPLGLRGTLTQSLATFSESSGENLEQMTNIFPSTMPEISPPASENPRELQSFDSYFSRYDKEQVKEDSTSVELKAMDDLKSGMKKTSTSLSPNFFLESDMPVATSSNITHEQYKQVLQIPNAQERSQSPISRKTQSSGFHVETDNEMTDSHQTFTTVIPDDSEKDVKLSKSKSSMKNRTSCRECSSLLSDIYINKTIDLNSLSISSSRFPRVPSFDPSNSSLSIDIEKDERIIAVKNYISGSDTQSSVASILHKMSKPKKISDKEDVEKQWLASDIKQNILYDKAGDTIFLTQSIKQSLSCNPKFVIPSITTEIIDDEPGPSQNLQNYVSKKKALSHSKLKNLSLSSESDVLSISSPESSSFIFDPSKWSKTNLMIIDNKSSNQDANSMSSQDVKSQDK